MSRLPEALRRVRVVLVDPTYDGNLGMVARAMRNFGLTRMVLAGGKADPAADEARWYARTEAETILDSAERHPTLDAALEGCRMVIGTSRRLGKKRGPAATPREIFDETTPWSVPWETALLFGREAHGLSTDELDRCQRLVWIPTDDACPSLNLSHAVSLIGFELAQATRAHVSGSEATRVEQPLEPATAEEVEAMFQHARRVWTRIGYLHAQNPDAILRRWRRIFGRTQLSEYDVRVVRALLHQTDWVAGVAQVPEGGPPDARPGLFDKHRSDEASKTRDPAIDAARPASLSDE